MATHARAYRTTILILWAALLGITLWFASTHQNIASTIVFWFAAASAIEITLYLAPGFAYTRDLFESIEPPVVRALMLACSALVPYFVYAVGTGTFHLQSFGLLAVLVTLSSAWFIALPAGNVIADICFVALFYAVVLSKAFDETYITLAKPLTASILGQLMWIRVGIFSMLSIRNMGGTGFGLVPSFREWTVGVACYLAFVPPAALVGYWIHFAQPHIAAGPWWRVAVLIAGNMAAFLWVVSLHEEFFFRGVLQQLASKHFGTAAGLIGISIIFGLGHLPFAHRFPNWRMAIMAALAGLFYGYAYIRAGSVRASMVTHALVVTSWRVFFA